MVDMAHAQLHLIEDNLLDAHHEPTAEQWKLDHQTIEVGRQGLADARAALARSARPFATSHRVQTRRRPVPGSTHRPRSVAA